MKNTNKKQISNQSKNYSNF